MRHTYKRICGHVKSRGPSNTGELCIHTGDRDDKISALSCSKRGSELHHFHFSLCVDYKRVSGVRFSQSKHDFEDSGLEDPLKNVLIEAK